MPDESLHFGPVVIRPSERSVSVDGRPVAVGARAFDVLHALAVRRDRLVTREELLEIVWPGVIVEEHNITAQISSLRKLLGPHVIATVPGRGYRFVAAAEEAHAPVPAAGATQPHNLPSMRTRFIGRESEIARVRQLLAGNRLLTLTGIGGSGKTRLAIESARKLAGDGFDDVGFVDLAPLTASERVAQACANVLGIADADSASLLDRLAAHAASRRWLIVLDNCEQVLGGAAEVASALVSGNGTATRVLATSREPLGVPGEQLLPLPPLSLPATDGVDEAGEADAVRLFVDRVRLCVPDFDVDATNARAIVEICRRLDGIALAIELAAARVPLLSVTDIAARLNDRFRLLTHASAANARQRTLASTLQWSYDQLGPDEQRVLRVLSVFAGGCTLDALAAVADITDEYEALDRLTTLYAKSLLVIERGLDPDGTSRPRYAMLETVRQYARERLDESGEGDAIRTRHAAHFVALAEKAAPHLTGPLQSRWMEILRREHENLAAALGHCVDEGAGVDRSWGLRLAAASSRYWVFNEVELGCRLALAALERDRDGGDSAARFDTLRGLAGMYMHRGQGAAGLPHARAALALARRAGDRGWQATALNAVGTCLNRNRDEEDAMRHYAEARELAEASGDIATLSAVLNNMANIDFSRGRLEAAERGFSEALRIARGSGDVRSALIFLHNLVRTTVGARKHADAHGYARQAEALLRDVGEDALKLELIEVTAGLASSEGEHALAARWWGFACPRFIEQGYRRPPEDQALLDGLSAASQRAIGEAAFERARAAGQALDMATALQELRGWLGQAP